MEMEMDSSMSELKVMKRSCNYSAPELECLLNHLEANPTLAAGFRPGAVLTQADFQLAWDAIAEQITAAGGSDGSKRTGADVKKKWTDLKSRARGKANKITLEMKASGYSSTKLSTLEKRVIDLVNMCEEEIEKNKDKPVPVKLVNMRKEEIGKNKDKLPLVIELANICEEEVKKKGKSAPIKKNKKRPAPIKKKKPAQDLKFNKVFSYSEESGSENISRYDTDNAYESNDISMSERDIIVKELKSKKSSIERKKRISKAFASTYESDENSMSETDLGELRSKKSSEEKIKRISKAFTSTGKTPSPKRLKLSEDEQLQQLFSAQQEISSELHTIKDILKKCQVSVEKLAVLKTAELQLKCAKYGVNFDDLFY